MKETTQEANLCVLYDGAVTGGGFSAEKEQRKQT